MLIAGILAEIQATYDLADKYVERYYMRDRPEANAGAEGLLSFYSAQVDDTKAARDSKPQASRGK